MSSSEPTSAALGDRETAFMCAQVGPYRLVFDLRTLLSIEGQSLVDHEAIRGPVDLRTWLGLPNRTAGETLLVLSPHAVVRLVVDRVDRLARSELRQIHPMPAVLAPLTRRLHLRGVVEQGSALAYLVDPATLVDQFLFEGAM